MKINKVHCLFEQSGTFKNEFIKLGIPAEDYDIQDEFEQTDHVIDLFAEIRGGYEGKPSIFDNISQDDLILSFFPCVRFENQIMLWFRGQSFSLRDYTLEQKMEFDMNLMKELKEMYDLVNMLFIICLRKDLKMIFENPYSEEHFLRRYWCLPSTMIDRDRTERGDYFTKPTQYWFLNCDPSNNMIFELVNNNQIIVEKVGNNDAWGSRASKKVFESTGATNKKTGRSMIHPDYANRFIREFIL